MASPQLDDGYTRIANALMEALIRAELPSVQTRIVLLVMRETYGFQRKTVKIGYQALSARYGIGRTMLIREMAALVSRNVLTKDADDAGNTWGIQKDYTQWVTSHSTVTSIQAETSHQNGVRLVTPQIPVTSHSTVTTLKKEKEIKEISTGDARARQTPPSPTGWIVDRLSHHGIASVQADKVIAAFDEAKYSLTPSDLDAVDAYLADPDHKIAFLLSSWLYKGKVPPRPRINGHTNGLSPPRRPQPDLHEEQDELGNVYLALADGTPWESDL